MELSVSIEILLHVHMCSSDVMPFANHYSSRVPYDGPYKVLARADQFFTVDVNGLHDTISLDHLEPAYLDKAL